MNLVQKFYSLFSPTKQTVSRQGFTVGGTSYAGENVTADSALSETAVYACTRLISSSIASLPLRLFQTSPEGSLKVTGTKLSRLFSKSVNPATTAFNWKRATVAQLLIHGNSYSFIDYLGDEPMALWLLNPAEVTVDLVNSIPQYKLKGKTFTDDQIIHFKNFSMDGLYGLSVLEQHKHKIGENLAAVKYGSGLFKNGAKVSGVLKHAGTLSPEARQRLVESWTSTYQGSDNAFKTVLLEEGLDFSPISMKPSDLEFLETRKFNTLEMCRIFGVPPHMLGANEKPTYASVEQASIEFLNYTISPLLNLIEQTLDQKFFPMTEDLYFKFNQNAFLRTDVKTRYESYKIAIQNGWMSINEVRELEEMNVIPNGDSHFFPLNMGPLNRGEDQSE